MAFELIPDDIILALVFNRTNVLALHIKNIPPHMFGTRLYSNNMAQRDSNMQFRLHYRLLTEKQICKNSTYSTSMQQKLKRKYSSRNMQLMQDWQNTVYFICNCVVTSYLRRGTLETLSSARNLPKLCI